MVRTVSGHLALGRGREIPRVARAALLPVALVSAVAGLLVFAFAQPLAELLASSAMAPTVRGCLRVVAVALPFAAVYQVLESTSRGYGTVRPSIAVEKVGRVSQQLAGIGAVAALGLGPVAVTVAWSVPWVVALVALALWTRALHRARADSAVPAPPEDPDAAASFWRFAAPRAPAATFRAGVMWSDTLILAALTTTAQTGIYSAATRYMIVGSFAQLAVSQTIQPIFGRLIATDDLGAAEETYRTGSAWLVALTWPMFLAAAIFAVPLLRVFGPAFVTADTALAILSLGWLVATGCGPVDNLLLMAGRSGWTSLNAGVGLALNVGLNLWLIPRYGINGAAAAWAASLMWMNVAPLVQVRATLHMSPFGPAWPVAATGALGVFGGCLVLSRVAIGETALGLVVGLVVAGGAYGTFLWLLRRSLHLHTFAAGLRRRRTQPA
ncbi:MAG: polysaccharide biosynthesis protein [Actinobacteria bacterium]|nr:polysaccharide biosynthesis protein [Actinomycetota bacterium]